MKSELVQDFKAGTKLYEPYPPRDKSGLLAQIQFVGHEYVGQNYYINREGFESFMLTLVGSGSTKIIIDNVVRTVGKNEMIFLDCLKGQVSWTEPPMDGSSISAEFYYLHFYPNEWIRSLHRYLTSSGSILNLGEDTIGYKKLVTDIIDALETKTFDEWEYSKRIYEMFYRLTKEMENKKEAGTPEVIQRVVAYLSDNYDKKITLSDLADLVHLTPNYLEFLFDKAMKQPVFSYLGNYRFHKSTELLLQSNLSIEEIAAKVGLTERKALIRLFKKNIGMTPLAYRKFYNQSHPIPENKNDRQKSI